MTSGSRAWWRRHATTSANAPTGVERDLGGSRRSAPGDAYEEAA
ncbi:MAG TPA: hypothetical protein VGG05_06145 [Pseudonocardiaceae bacterium]